MSAGTTLVRDKTPVNSIVAAFRNNISQYSMLIALVGIMGFFQIMTGGILMQPVNLTNLVLQNSYIVIMAIGMLLVIVAGHIDLSVGSIAAFVGAVAAVMMVEYNVNFILVIAISIVLGAVIGGAQGYWVAYQRIPSFIVTLAGMLVFRGLTLAMLQGRSLGPFATGFQKLSSGFLPDLFANQSLHLTSIVIGVIVSAVVVYLDWRGRQNQVKYGFSVSPLGLFVVKNVLITSVVIYISYLMASYKGLPNVLVVLFVLIVAYAFFTNQTTFGRRIYALGGNLKAAALSGINTTRLTFLTFVNMGMLAALGGLIIAARLNVATPKAGTGIELDVIAAAFIGGASATGGIGTVIGAVIGALGMGVMNNGMSILGIGIDWQQAIKGLVLLAAVWFDVRSRVKS
ncbi:MAG TPA: sugar ABC transporter permease [Anaerolineae bacterium]|nr:sugar ABC transporter permease [Anaerolineae bacterium]